MAADPARMEIFLVATPGLEDPLADEARECGFDAQVQPGGVTFIGGWPDVWRANLEIRGATRVLARIGAFRAMHPAQLDKRARRFPWADWLRPDVPIRIETPAASPASITPAPSSSGFRLQSRNPWRPDHRGRAGHAEDSHRERDLCTISLDSSNWSLHKRGHKQAVGKAPMRDRCGTCGWWPRSGWVRPGRSIVGHGKRRALSSCAVHGACGPGTGGTPGAPDI